MKYDRLIREVIEKTYIIYRVTINVDDIVAICNRIYYQHLDGKISSEIETNECVIFYDGSKLVKCYIQLDEETVHYIDKKYILFKEIPFNFKKKYGDYAKYNAKYLTYNDYVVTYIRDINGYLEYYHYTNKEFNDRFQIDYTNDNFKLIDNL